MSKRMALVPPEFLIGHRQQKSELRLENELSQLLERDQLPDDHKVKLLSQLLTRYQNVLQEPSEPIRVSIVDENENPKIDTSKKETVQDKILENVKSDLDMDPILKDIMLSSPRAYVKYIPPIVEKLMTRGIQNFQIFLKAIREINIPHSWIGNKKLHPRLKSEENVRELKSNDTSPDLDSVAAADVKFDIDEKHGGWQSPSRTIKRGSYKYVDILNKVLKSYNNTIHSTTSFSPNQVTSKLESIIFNKVYGYNKDIHYAFNIGEQVRISKAKKTFQRGYLPNWSDEVFTISERFASNPPTYSLKDLVDTKLKGRFYESELQKISKDSNSFWRVEKIIRTKGVGAKKEYLVKWKDVDKVIDSSRTFKFRPSQQFPVDLSFFVVDRNPLSVSEHTVPIVSDASDNVIVGTPRELFDVIKENIRLLNLEDLIQFIYDDITSEVEIHLANNIEIHFTRALGESLLEKLNLLDDTIVKGISRFRVNRVHPIDKKDHFKIIVKDYFKEVEVFEQVYELFLDVGMYKTEQELFNAFQFITLKQQPNSHVAIDVPKRVELHLGQG
ncbi:hypothetical protein HNY73_007493 [Argiope bruennichi]|uniref:Chromo domain-containing protein n=1 Tax=Argiope bruennichi TaxID=94029 RepID=A0A8T0FL67_ARGBR|nr:hypothetical protein HNY73_007493 [Argiope bruennichi]